MVYIEIDTNAMVVYINYAGKDLGKGYMVESIPEPEEQENKIPVMYYRDGKVAYEYVNAPENPTPEPEPEPEIKPAMETQMATFARMMTRTMVDIQDEVAVEIPDCFDEWADLIGETLEKGRIISHNGKTYRLLQQHVVQAHFVPGAQGMESIYAVIDKKHTGTIEDPIPYYGNMTLENGKYYIQDGVKYKCTRDTGIPVYQPLSDLVGQYVEVVE